MLRHWEGRDMDRSRRSGVNGKSRWSLRASLHETLLTVSAVLGVGIRELSSVQPGSGHSSSFWPKAGVEMDVVSSRSSFDATISHSSDAAVSVEGPRILHS